MNQTTVPPSTPSTTPRFTYQPEKKKSNFWKWLLGGFGCVAVILISCGACAYILYFSTQSWSATGIADTAYSAKTLWGSGEDIVAVIDINGVIQDFAGAESLLTTTSASAESILQMIDYAIEDQNADAILFRLNTPGGTLTGAETVCHKINEIRKEGVYTMSWIETEGASGGYYIASCTDWIVSRQEAITGSIGVVIQVIDINSFLESIGFKVRVISNTEGTLKSGDDIFIEGSETEQIYREVLDEGYNQFIDAVTTGREDKDKRLTRAQITALADGRIYTGLQAEENGLIDELGYYEDAIESVISKADLEQGAKVIQIEPQVSFLDSFAGITLRKLFPIEIDAQQPGITLMAISTY